MAAPTSRAIFFKKKPCQQGAVHTWRNLKQGWDLFEARREPPDVRACGKNYRFDEAPHAANCTRIAGL